MTLPYLTCSYIWLFIGAVSVYSCVSLHYQEVNHDDCHFGRERKESCESSFVASAALTLSLPSRNST